MSRLISAAAGPAVVEPAVVAPTSLEVSSVDVEEAWMVDNWDAVGGAEVVVVEGDKDDTKVFGVPYKKECARKDGTLWEPALHDKAWDSEASDDDMEYQLDLTLVVRWDA